MRQSFPTWRENPKDDLGTHRPEALALPALGQPDHEQPSLGRRLDDAPSSRLHESWLDGRPGGSLDQQAGIVRLPIDRAMQVVVRDLRRNPESATAAKPAEPQNGDGAQAEGAPAAQGGPDGAGEPGEKAGEPGKEEHGV